VASRCRTTGAGWWSWPRSTTCSRAPRRRRCRTSTWPSDSRKPKASPPTDLWEGCSRELFARIKSSRLKPLPPGPGKPTESETTMSDLLWQKPGVAVDARIQAFLAGDDVVLDREFFLHDIAASRAHAQGLQRIGILSADELAAIA